MSYLVHELIVRTAQRTPQAEALCYQTQRLSYADLAQQIQLVSEALQALDIARHDRVAVFLEKRIENVVTLFAASAASAVFVPVNPLLKAEQVAYILKDCNVKILVTSSERISALLPVLKDCPELQTLIVVGKSIPEIKELNCRVLLWQDALTMASERIPQHHQCIDRDMAAILYTSGSTGKPKGVVLSHRNLIAGAESVAEYLQNCASDRILSVLPLSFDYGLSQLTTAFLVGASVVLMNYLMPRDILNAVAEERITGLAAVPPLWLQLAQQRWPEKSSLRYITNSGGAMQGATLSKLRQLLPEAKVFLMYGLTEAFRSTYLAPDQVDIRPDSIGKAIPNAEILVVRPDGSECAPDEAGELVHRGALVSQGYWNDKAKTQERFKPISGTATGLVFPEIAVWSGDTVRRDAEGYLYFIGRTDDMIKVSGYRISPTEIEEIISGFQHVNEVAAIGVPHSESGQAIVLVIQPDKLDSIDVQVLRKEMQRHLPGYMLPSHIAVTAENLPRNPNGKIDRKLLQLRFHELFVSVSQ
ncbi:acyl-CoA ligase (AMP-forming), exosortase A system-associated [Undibacterium sp. Xuan67W]|uniref:acyl-CoA ligase (AMP-forming), exosortase A system-associated n=1 Tax=Undibacterium sp. Xuan67W TaxID=3413057 RepID=UPI003BEF77F0